MIHPATVFSSVERKQPRSVLAPKMSLHMAVSVLLRKKLLILPGYM